MYASVTRRLYLACPSDAKQRRAPVLQARIMASLLISPNTFRHHMGVIVCTTIATAEFAL